MLLQLALMQYAEPVFKYVYLFLSISHIKLIIDNNSSGNVEKTTNISSALSIRIRSNTFFNLRTYLKSKEIIMINFREYIIFALWWVNISNRTGCYRHFRRAFISRTVRAAVRTGWKASAGRWRGGRGWFRSDQNYGAVPSVPRHRRHPPPAPRIALVRHVESHTYTCTRALRHTHAWTDASLPFHRFLG